ncbi:MAG TPA: hypothetical protein DCW68_07695 [Rhodospirillaceae bacterium]|nr:MAG: hypothetical protein A2018_08085 [Alphaproteobacteria bacterium GWF2_58_20]HAU29970.1 hypothetical protein [Rhodospirillaceae bacterium]
MAEDLKPENKIEAEKKPAAGHSSGLDAVVTRNAFYQDGYRRLIFLAMVEAVAIVVLLGVVLGFVTMWRPQDRFFATTTAGHVIALVPANQPVLDDSRVAEWSRTAFEDILRFNYMDYRERLISMSPDFSERGYATWLSILKRDGFVDSVVNPDNLFSVSTQVTAQPMIVQKGVSGGLYRWRIQMQAVTNFISARPNRSYAVKWNVTLEVVRVPSLHNNSGIGIEQVVLSKL